MTRQAFIVTGLGFGDEGKGAVTHWLSCRHEAHTVIRTGGPQALHHVVTASGREHVFSQFGSGSFRGARTHLSQHMLVDPHGILSEGDHLKYQGGIGNIFEMMTIHEDALVITPFQALAGRVRELLRAEARRGSVGIGVGETVLDSEILGADALRVRDLASPSLREKLVLIQAHKWREFEEYADRASELPASTAVKIRMELKTMGTPETVQWALQRFTELARKVRVVDTDYVAREILGRDGTVVCEGSQGVLLDRYHGFHPYTTKVRTTPSSALALLAESGYRGEVANLGLLRAYHTRHGGGPFVTESALYTQELPDACNKEHPWQGGFRVGPFDALAARYALRACQGMDAKIDGIILTCLDRMIPRGRLEICTAYAHNGGLLPPDLFTESSPGSVADIISAGAESPETLLRQERLGAALAGFAPRLESIWLPAEREDAARASADALRPLLGTDILAVSFGQSEDDKIIL